MKGLRCRSTNLLSFRGRNHPTAFEDSLAAGACSTSYLQQTGSQLTAAWTGTTRTAMGEGGRLRHRWELCGCTGTPQSINIKFSQRDLNKYCPSYQLPCTAFPQLTLRGRFTPPGLFSLNYLRVFQNEPRPTITFSNVLNFHIPLFSQTALFSPSINRY